MGQLRRAALVALVAMAEACLSAPSPPKEADVKVDNGEHPGQFSVTNAGSTPIDLSRKVTVERAEAGKWIETAALVNLVASCEEKNLATTPRRFAAGEELKVAPWNGWGCNGQCPRACRSNYYLGPGRFRFVVRTADHMHRFEGAAFTLGPEPPR